MKTDMSTEEESVQELREDRSTHRFSSSCPENLSSRSRRMTSPRRSSILSGSLSAEEQHHARLGEYTASLWKQNSMTDILIVVHGKDFQAHKAVLACYSPYFKEVLLKPGVNNVHHLEIPSVTELAFEILLTYMYTGELKVTCQELSDVYRAARRLGMKDALNRCIKLLSISSTCLANTIYLYVTARKLDLLDPSVRAFRVMVRHFEELVTTQEFLDLDVDQVVDFLSADEIGARSEVIVFVGALKWLHYKYMNREQYTVQVMSCVRFPLMSLEEIIACYHPPFLPGIVEVPGVKTNLLESICYVAAKTLGQESLFKEFSCPPRKYLLEGEPIVLWDTTVYDPVCYPEYRKNKAAIKIQSAFRGHRTREWFEKLRAKRNKAATIIQSHFRGFETRKKLFPGRSRRMIHKSSSNQVSLGVAKLRHTDSSYNPESVHLDEETASGLLSTVSPLVTGLTSSIPIASTRAIKAPSNTNPNSEEIPVPLAGHAVDSSESEFENQCSGNVIFAVGGFDIDDEGIGNAILSYCPDENCWRDLGTLPQPRHDIRIALLAGSIYCIGGCDSSVSKTGNVVPQKLCYRYQLDTQKWQTLPPLHHARMFHGVAVVNDSILVVGGKDESGSILSSLEVYDAANNKWREMTCSLPFPRMAMGVASYRGMLWVVGGMTVRRDKVVIVDSFDCLDIETGRWFKKPKLPAATGFVKLVKCSEKLYALGGTVQVGDEPDLVSVVDVYVYDAIANGWKNAVHLPIPCHSVVAAALDEDIYVLGGFTTYEMSFLKEVFYYDSVRHQWRPCCRLPASAYGYMISAVSTSSAGSMSE